MFSHKLINVSHTRHHSNAAPAPAGEDDDQGGDSAYGKPVVKTSKKARALAAAALLKEAGVD